MKLSQNAHNKISKLSRNFAELPVTTTEKSAKSDTPLTETGRKSWKNVAVATSDRVIRGTETIAGRL